MAKTFKDFLNGSPASDSKKALNSLKEMDNKYLEKRSAKYFKEEDLEDIQDLEIDPETYKKYLTK